MVHVGIRVAALRSSMGCSLCLIPVGLELMHGVVVCRGVGAACLSLGGIGWVLVPHVMRSIGRRGWIGVVRRWGTHVHGEVDANIGVTSVGSSGGGGGGFGGMWVMWRVVGRIGPVVRIFWIFVGLFFGLFLYLEVFVLIGRIWVRRAIGVLILIPLCITHVEPMACICFKRFVFERQLIVFSERNIEFAWRLSLQSIFIGIIGEEE